MKGMLPIITSTTGISYTITGSIFALSCVGRATAGTAQGKCLQNHFRRECIGRVFVAMIVLWKKQTGRIINTYQCTSSNR